jgi:hypothetical protein
MTQNPVFKPAVIPFMTFANSNDDTPVRIRLLVGQRVIGMVTSDTKTMLK